MSKSDRPRPGLIAFIVILAPATLLFIYSTRRMLLLAAELHLSYTDPWSSLIVVPMVMILRDETDVGIQARDIIDNGGDGTIVGSSSQPAMASDTKPLIGTGALVGIVAAISGGMGLVFFGAALFYRHRLRRIEEMVRDADRGEEGLEDEGQTRGGLEVNGMSGVRNDASPGEMSGEHVELQMRMGFGKGEVKR